LVIKGRGTAIVDKPPAADEPLAATVRAKPFNWKPH